MAFIQGMLMGFAMILLIGPQNMFVLMQGMRRRYHLLSASVCFMSDVILLSAGIFGAGALLLQNTLLLNGVTLGGVGFLGWYGWGALKTALISDTSHQVRSNTASSRAKVLLTLLAVTWLNPHVYLDTVVVLGSVGSQYSETLRPWFAFGAISASFIWFYALALSAAKLSSWLSIPRVQRVINLFVGLFMWFIAYRLVLSVWFSGE